MDTPERFDEYDPDRKGLPEYIDRGYAHITEQKFRRVVLFWVRTIGWIVLVWAILTLISGVWIAVELSRLEPASSAL